MARLTITINTDNAAFERDAFEEVSRILRELSDELKHRSIPTKVRDINGNTVGTVRVSED